MRKLVEREPDHFRFFKESLLRGLIIRYCNDFASGRNIERLNKLLAIYAEHLRNLEPTEEISMVIDEEFASELKAKKKYGSLDSKDSLSTVERLIDRKYPLKHSWIILHMNLKVEEEQNKNSDYSEFFLYYIFHLPLSIKSIFCFPLVSASTEILSSPKT